MFGTMFPILVSVLTGGDRACDQKPAGGRWKETEEEENQKGGCQGPMQEEERCKSS